MSIFDDNHMRCLYSLITLAMQNSNIKGNTPKNDIIPRLPDDIEEVIESQEP